LRSHVEVSVDLADSLYWKRGEGALS
jgi:hypothetical protein